MSYTKQSRAYVRLAEWLRTRREMKGIGVRQLASMLDVSPSTISKIESNQRKVDAFELFLYARVLDIPPEEVAVRMTEIIFENPP